MQVDLVTKTDLAEAIRAKLKIPEEAAEANAEFVLDIFGFDHQVIDNVLEPEDRQFFYTLQENGILTTRSEETLLWNGQEWRTHSWLMRVRQVQEIAAASRGRGADASPFAEADTVYTGLPDQAWTRIRK